MSVATASPLNIEPVTLPPAGAAAWVTVDLAALVANWRAMTTHVGPGCTVAGVVKADAYGLGLLPVARALANVGCRWFFVAVPDEAFLLAEAFALTHPTARIAVLSGPIAGTARSLAQFPSVVPVLNDLGQIALWREAAPGRRAILHLDTGMARLGLPETESALLIDEPWRLDSIPLALVMSHLACADQPDHPMNAVQHERFVRLSAAFKGVPRSLSASGGSFINDSFHFDLVRIGAALYGINPLSSGANPIRQVLGLQARIVQIRDIDPGTSVGYGASYVADRPRRVATLAAGYADGILRMAGNQARCFIGSVETPVVGRISMDFMTIDISDVPAEMVKPDMAAHLIGPHYRVDALARDCGTVGYEITTRLGARLPRIYAA
jgi:alanine racemase